MSEIVAKNILENHEDDLHNQLLKHKLSTSVIKIMCLSNWSEQNEEISWKHSVLQELSIKEVVFQISGERNIIYQTELEELAVKKKLNSSYILE